MLRDIARLVALVTFLLACLIMIAVSMNTVASWIDGTYPTLWLSIKHTASEFLRLARSIW